MVRTKMTKIGFESVGKADSAFLWFSIKAKMALGADQPMFAFSSNLNNWHWIPFLV